MKKASSTYAMAFSIVSVAGQQVQGKADVSQKQVIEREILAVAAGRSTKERLTFNTVTNKLTRELGGERESEDKPNPLQGKSVVATRNGLSWSFAPVAGNLSNAEMRDLQTHVGGIDEGFPREAVPVGHRAARAARKELHPRYRFPPRGQEG